MVGTSLVSFFKGHIAREEINRKINGILDLIRHRVSRLGLESTIDSLRPDFWEIRMQMVEIILESEGLGEYPVLLQEGEKVLANVRDEFTPHSIHAFQIYRKTIEGFIEKLPPRVDIKELRLPPDMDMPYDTVLGFSMYPNWSFRYLAEYIKSSLDFDMSLFILDMIREESLDVDKEEFIGLMRRSGERFGAYAAVLGFWDIPDEDETQPIRNTKIVAGMLEFKKGQIGEVYSLDQLKEMLIG